MRRESSKIISSAPATHGLTLPTKVLDMIVRKPVRWAKPYTGGKGSGTTHATWYNRDISPNR